jgi:hypothetical protein
LSLFPAFSPVRELSPDQLFPNFILAPGHRACTSKRAVARSSLSIFHQEILMFIISFWRYGFCKNLGEILIVNIFTFFF